MPRTVRLPTRRIAQRAFTEVASGSKSAVIPHAKTFAQRRISAALPNRRRLSTSAARAAAGA
ncbi:hypothetical protein AQ611_15865 [Burkholderia singularis]|nr:hypothetical protein AQ611_15865 [Burkholderia sp. Bp7605]